MVAARAPAALVRRGVVAGRGRGQPLHLAASRGALPALGSGRVARRAPGRAAQPRPGAASECGDPGSRTGARPGSQFPPADRRPGTEPISLETFGQPVAASVTRPVPTPSVCSTCTPIATVVPTATVPSLPKGGSEVVSSKVDERAAFVNSYETRISSLPGRALARERFAFERRASFNRTRRGHVPLPPVLPGSVLPDHRIVAYYGNPHAGHGCAGRGRSAHHARSPREAGAGVRDRRSLPPGPAGARAGGRRGSGGSWRRRHVPSAHVYRADRHRGPVGGEPWVAADPGRADRSKHRRRRGRATHSVLAPPVRPPGARSRVRHGPERRAWPGHRHDGRGGDQRRHQDALDRGGGEETCRPRCSSCTASWTR